MNRDLAWYNAQCRLCAGRLGFRMAEAPEHPAFFSSYAECDEHILTIHLKK